jgi:two-component system response regulator AlgR
LENAVGERRGRTPAEEVDEVADVRVLIVDDQEPYRRAMAAVVAATDGFAVAGTATTGEESLAVAADLHPDLVLMDVNVPGIDGVEATRRLAAGPAAPVVVLLSTYDVDQVDVAGSGAAAYIAKADLGPDRLSAVWRERHG